VAKPGERLTVIRGQVPRPGALPSGCRFHPRCPHAVDACADAPVALTRPSDVAAARCVRQRELVLSGAPAVAEAPTGLVAATETAATPLLDVVDLRKQFPIVRGVLRRVHGHVQAVDGVTFAIDAGETLGLVGESGSGKSTVARLVLRLLEASGGSVRFDGEDLMQLTGRRLQQARRDLQIIFQDPYSSLDPRSTIADAIGEPLEIHDGLGRRERDFRSGELLELVGMGPHLLRRYPYEFSGGQRQRIAVARALALNPRLLVCDEPVSALDVSTQSQVINLLADLQERLGLAYLFIAHDLSVVRHLSHRIAVMYLGRIVEIGPADEVSYRPTHPYTEALLSAIPIPDPAVQRSRKRIVLEGDIPSPTDPPAGCRFHTRCQYAMDVCAHEDPPPFASATGTTVWCHLHTTGPTLVGAPVTMLPARS
jgi:oligopeptide/dipeptide ABC transporter ATP-binding protein